MQSANQKLRINTTQEMSKKAYSFLLVAILGFLMLSGCESDSDQYCGFSTEKIRKNPAYIEEYNQRLREYKERKTDANYDYNVKMGEGEMLDFVLAGKYKLRRLNFPDYKFDGFQIKELALLDAWHEFIRSEYHVSFEEIEQEALKISTEYRVQFFKDLTQNLTLNSIEKEITEDSLEIGRLKINFLDSLPFYILVDTFTVLNFFNKFQYEKNDSMITFLPKVKNETKLQLLPSLHILYYWDSSKTDYPYPQYPLNEVRIPFTN